jgi:PIN domain nuclease of toxin-antitoxin system
VTSLLLDTHIVLGLIESGDRPLDPALRRTIESSEVDRTVSVATIWEIAIKHRLGKLRLATEPQKLPSLFMGMGFALLPIDHRHALAAVDPEPATRDPFDRLLLGQCAVEGLRLITLDRALADHPLAWRAA